MRSGRREKERVRDIRSSVVMNKEIIWSYLIQWSNIVVHWWGT